KLFGDVNGDGNMVYVEYKCDLTTTPGFLYRTVLANTAVAKPAPGLAEVLLSNVIANPGGTSCFTYQQQSVTASNGTAPPGSQVANTYVTDVAITLTVQTEL